jgi:hypothetical protein
MGPSSPIPDFAAFYIRKSERCCFGLVFFFLYRQSRVVYFGLWAIAWLLRFLAGIFGYQLLRSGSLGWMAPYAVFEFGFAIVLIAAARAGFASSIKDWRTVLRLISILPIFVALIYAFGWYSRFDGYRAADAVVLCGVYVYNFVALRKNTGLGARVFRGCLLVLAAGLLVRALEFAGLFRIYLRLRNYGDFILSACSVLPPWRCGMKARSTASANWRARWTTCAASRTSVSTWITSRAC